MCLSSWEWTNLCTDLFLAVMHCTELLYLQEIIQKKHFPSTKWCVPNNNYGSCSWVRMKLVHCHYHEWLIYVHVWEPISGSALVDSPSLNPEAWAAAKRLDLQQAQLTIWKRIIALTCVIIKDYLKEVVFLTDPTRFVSQGSSEREGRIRQDEPVDSWGCVTEFLLCCHTLQFNSFFKHWNFDVILWKQYFGFPTSRVFL